MNPVDFPNIVLYKGYLHAAVGWHVLYFPNRFFTLFGRLDGKVVRLDKRWTQNGPRLDGGWLVPVRLFSYFLHFPQICLLHFVAGWMEKLSGWTNISKRSLI